MFFCAVVYIKRGNVLVYSEKYVPLQRIADMAQLVEQRIRNA